jgi:hypothetical protein
MKLSAVFAKKLLLLLNGEEQPLSAINNEITDKMVDDGVLQIRNISRNKKVVFAPNPSALEHYLSNHFGIKSISDYITHFENPAPTRTENIQISTDSKLRKVRTFKGFLINSYDTIQAELNGKPFTISPTDGSFTFIFDFETFSIPKEITIVGVENPANFRFIQQIRYLFPNITPLFVSRYPYSHDLLKWLQRIPNRYLHFGDLDFEGIGIYLNEYQKILGEKSSYCIPENAEALIAEKGNRELYFKQYNSETKLTNCSDKKLLDLVKCFHQNQKVLEQEIFIIQPVKS